MKYFLLVVLIIIFPTSVIASVYGVSNDIGQPGFYGQIQLGNDYPRLQLIYSEPVLIRKVRTDIGQQLPIYLPYYNSRHFIFAQNRYYESNRQYYDNYQDRRYDSHRHHDDQNRGMRHDNGQYEQGYDNNRGKYDKDRHGNKSRDRERSRN